MNRVIIIGSLAVLLLLMGSAVGAPPCSSVFSELAPCLSYLKGDSDPSSACCTGVKGIGGEISTKGDREAVCQCLKQGLSLAGSYDPNKIPQLPGKCGVSINLPPITPTTNCATAMEFD